MIGPMRRVWWVLPLLLAPVGCSEVLPRPLVVAGVLDLRGWSFETDGVVEFVGDWEFCWDQLLTPGEVAGQDGRCGTMPVPGLWTDQPSREGRGYATYRLRVLLPVEHPPLSLRAGSPMTAHQLWVNGRRYPGSGKVTRSPVPGAAQLANRIHVLPEGAPALELLLQVSNFDFRSGGLRRRWILGSHEEVRAWANLLTVRETTVAAINILVGLLYLGFFAIRPQERARLYFALCCLVLGLRGIPASYSDIGQIILPNLPFPLQLRWEYIANNLVVFGGIGYFALRIPGEISPRLVRVLQIVSLVAVAVIASFPLPIVIWTFSVASVTGVAMIAAGLVGLVRAARHGVPHVRPTLAVMPLCLGAVAWDALRAEGVILSPIELFPAAMLLMVLTEALVLMLAFSRSYDTIEKLSEDLAAANEDLRETNRAAVRFVPFDFLRLLNRDSIRDVQRGDCHEQEMSIVFCDIRSFTSRVESMTPDDAFRFVNAFTHSMEPAIHEQGGFINQYIGDCIMALFPAGGDEALRAGIGMLGALEGFNREEHERSGNGVLTRIGIGINSGPLMLGTIGGEERLEDAVIGDAVNLASRVESLTKVYGVSFLISGTTWRKLADPSVYQLRELDLVIVKGRSESIPIYEVLDGLDPASRQRKVDGLDLFAEARNAYCNRSFAEAEARFGECLERCPEDLASQVYVERCQRLAVEGVPPTWRGETLLSEK